MPEFNAATVVEPLKIKLLPYVKKEIEIKEPNDDQVADFLRGMQKLMKDASGLMPDLGENADTATLLSQMEKIDPDKFVDLLAGMTEIFSDLCSGNPTAKDLQALPLRARLAFFRWLMSEVLGPEAAPGAGTGQAPSQA